MKWELESARCWEGCCFQFCSQWTCFVWCLCGWWEQCREENGTWMWGCGSAELLTELLYHSLMCTPLVSIMTKTLNFKLALFYQKHKAWTKQLQITDFFVRKRCAHLYWSDLLSVYYACRSKCEMYSFHLLCSLFMFMTHLVVSHNCHYSFICCFFTAVSQEVMGRCVNCVCVYLCMDGWLYVCEGVHSSQVPGH